MKIGGIPYQGTEMTADTANLVFENFVIEASLEFALTRRCCGHFRGGLTTTKNDIVLLRRHGGTVDGGVGRISLQDLQVVCGDKLRGQHASLS